MGVNVVDTRQQTTSKHNNDSCQRLLQQRKASV